MHSGAVPRRGPYHGWVVAVALGITTAVAYGVLSYAFAVFIAPMSAALGWSQAAITGAYSLALLIAAAAAVPVGRWIDRRGARGIMTAGGALGAASLLLWSGVSSLAGWYAIAALLGLSMATLFYEPAFAVIATWFEHRPGRALSVLTLLGGLASITFVPLAAWLVESYGWRSTLRWLALLLGGVTIPLHALLLRRHPGEQRRVSRGAADPRGSRPGTQLRLHSAVRSRSFVWLATSLALAGIVSSAIAVHLVSLLLARGAAPAAAGLALGVLGFMAVPTRLGLALSAGRVASAHLAAGSLAFQAIGLLALLAVHGPAGVPLFVVLFGAGAGAATPVRAALQADLYGSANYGAIGGALALPAAVARAAAPVGASLLLAASDSYNVVLCALLVIIGASALALTAAAAAADAERSPAPVTTA